MCEKKVLVVINSLRRGGIEIAAINFQSHIDRGKYNCTYFIRYSDNKDEALLSDILESGAEIIEKPSSVNNYFKEYIDIAIEKLYGCKLTDISKADYQKYKNYLLDALAQNYDNICYDSLGKQSVFSTWSINNFFCDATDLDEIAFDDYWFENGGLPTILRKYLQNHLIDFSALKQKEIVIGKDDFMNPTALQSMDLNVLMAQTGYLSLTKGYK